MPGVWGVSENLLYYNHICSSIVHIANFTPFQLSPVHSIYLIRCRYCGSSVSCDTELPYDELG